MEHLEVKDMQIYDLEITKKQVTKTKDELIAAYNKNRKPRFQATVNGVADRLSSANTKIAELNNIEVEKPTASQWAQFFQTK